MSGLCQKPTFAAYTQCGRDHPSAAPLKRTAFYFFSSGSVGFFFSSYSAGPDVDHADSRQQRSRLRLGRQQRPRPPAAIIVAGTTRLNAAAMLMHIKKIAELFYMAALRHHLVRLPPKTYMRGS